MARKAPKNRMSILAGLGDIQRDKHEEMLSDMYGALHTLGDAIRKPYSNSGDHLLPKGLKKAKEKPEAKAAREHIEDLHAHMKACKD